MAVCRDAVHGVILHCRVVSRVCCRVSQGVAGFNNVVLCVAVLCVTVRGKQRIGMEFAESSWQEIFVCVTWLVSTCKRHCKYLVSARGKPVSSLQCRLHVPVSSLQYRLHVPVSSLRHCKYLVSASGVQVRKMSSKLLKRQPQYEVLCFITMILRNFGLF